MSENFGKTFYTILFFCFFTSLPKKEKKSLSDKKHEEKWKNVHLKNRIIESFIQSSDTQKLTQSRN